MYPFERFTERAKDVLITAQEEAEDSSAGYIGTEHLLIALVREEGGRAAQVLGSLGVDLRRVRLALEGRLARFEPVSQGRVVPAGRTKTVIELAFREAERTGRTHVSTEHLLLAIISEGQGVGAQMLLELGLTPDRVRGEVERQLADAEPAMAASAVRPRSTRYRGAPRRPPSSRSCW